MKRFSYALMDEPLLRVFRYPLPRAWERRAALALMRLRAGLIARLPARRKAKWVRDFGYFRSYPGGYDVNALGTFTPPPGCPAHLQRVS